MHDVVAAELVQADFDHVMADHFEDSEQFIVYTKDQDYDLDTCLEMCDSIELLNEELYECDAQEQNHVALAESDFNEMLQMERNR